MKMKKKIHNNYDQFLETREFFNKYKEKLDKYYIMLPLYLYDHSDITMNTTGFSCPWDSGQVGWIYADLSMMRDLGYDWKIITAKRKAEILKRLKAIVGTYDNYLSGAVYGYQIESPGGFEAGSCCGYFGNNNESSGLMSDAKSDIDFYLRSSYKSHFENLKKMIKGKVGLQYRKSLKF